MNSRLRFAAWLLLVAFSTSGHALAGEKVKRVRTERTTTKRHVIYDDTTYSADAVAADIVIARPLWLVESVVGAGVFVLSAPFSAASRSMNRTARSLVIKPARATFRRTPGDFSSIQ